jgi:hypothetical protein
VCVTLGVSVLERGLLPHEICKLCLSALDAVVKFMCMFFCESVCCKKGFDLLPMFFRMRFVLFKIILEGRVLSCLPIHVKLPEIWFDLFCISCILALGLNHGGSRATRFFLVIPSLACCDGFQLYAHPFDPLKPAQ